MKHEIEFVEGGKIRKGYLTTEHAASSYNIPVCVDSDGQAYGSAEVLLVGGSEKAIEEAAAAGFRISQ